MAQTLGWAPAFLIALANALAKKPGVTNLRYSCRVARLHELVANRHDFAKHVGRDQLPFDAVFDRRHALGGWPNATDR